jgi:crotonobetainyl-CoA:carnitine CoA-transferase CaiB-like acyl-CoA transferase
MSGTPTEHTRVAPMLGEHTAEVLREFGLADGEIDSLRAANVIN